jgi:hypothetical protein
MSEASNRLQIPRKAVGEITEELIAAQVGEWLTVCPQELDKVLQEVVDKRLFSWEELLPDDPVLVYLLNRRLTTFSKIAKRKGGPPLPDNN